MRHYLKSLFWPVIIILFLLPVSCDNRDATSEYSRKLKKVKISFEHKMDTEIQIPRAVKCSMPGDTDSSTTEFDTPVHPTGKVISLEISEMPIELKNTELKNGILSTKDYGDIEVLLTGLKHGKPVFELRTSQPQIDYLKKRIIRYRNNKHDIFTAVLDNDIPKLKALIEREADLNVRSVDNVTPLIAATVMGRQKVIQILLDANVDVNAKDNKGWTALIHLASVIDSPEIARALIKAHADINAVGKDGATALIVAAMKGNMELVKTLVQAGADLNVAAKTTGHHFTALYAAEKEGHKEIAAFLKKSGAK